MYGCGQWVWLAGGGCGEWKWWNLWVWLAGGGCGQNLWVWLVGVVVRRYIDFLTLLIPTPLVFVNLKKCFSFYYCDDVIRKCRFYRSLFCNFYLPDDHWEVTVLFKSAAPCRCISK